MVREFASLCPLNIYPFILLAQPSSQDDANLPDTCGASVRLDTHLIAGILAMNIAINQGGLNMITVQMTLDEQLVKRVDSAVLKLKTTRSAFAREALKRALKEIAVLELEEKHRRGYGARPVAGNEFSGWEKEQSWGAA